MTSSVSTFFKFAAAGLAALAAASAVQARDNLHWSVGIGAAPGVSIGFGNARPVYVQPAPVYLAPQPVYRHYSQAVNPNYDVQPAAVYLQAAPLYYAPAPVQLYGYGHAGRHHGHHGRQGHHGPHGHPDHPGRGSGHWR